MGKGASKGPPGHKTRRSQSRHTQDCSLHGIATDSLRAAAASGAEYPKPRSVHLFLPRRLAQLYMQDGFLTVCREWAKQLLSPVAIDMKVPLFSQADRTWAGQLGPLFHHS